MTYAIPSCANCGIACPPDRKGRERKFCSRVCIGRVVGKNGAARYRGRSRIAQCLTCGSQIVSYYDNRKFCSRKCFGISRRGKPMRGYGRKDGNHSLIIETIEKAGGCVLDISTVGRGVPDLIVMTRKGIQLAEVKNPKTGYGRNGLAKSQQVWADMWRGGPVFVLRTIEDAIALVKGDFHVLEARGGWKAA